MFENFKPKKRLFKLSSGKTPVAYKIKTSSGRRPLLVVDVENGTQRELRYATNYSSPYLDEQGENAIIAHVWFRNGLLAINERDIALQKFLIAHPDNVANGGKIFEEVKKEAKAQQEIVNLEAAADALSLAKDFDINDASAIVYQLVGSGINQYHSAEIRRDLLNLALNNAPEFLKLANDEGVKVEWIAFQALKYQLLNKQGNAIFFGKSKKKLMTLKPSQNDVEGIADFFLTDDGLAALEEIKAKLAKLLK